MGVCGGLLCWQEWVSSLLWGVREILSLKLNRGEVSAVVGEEGPALDTVLDGPLLSAETERQPVNEPIQLHSTRVGERQHIKTGGSRRQRQEQISKTKR